MIDCVAREQVLPEHGLHVAYDRRIFLKTWSGIARSILKYDGVLPHDWLKVSITVVREIKTPKSARKERRKEFELLKKDMRKRRKARVRDDH